jgi:hypothetical protein
MAAQSSAIKRKYKEVPAQHMKQVCNMAASMNGM